MSEAWKHRIRGFLVFLLASPLGSVASFVVSRVPGLWQRVFLNPVLPPLDPAGIDELKRWVSRYPDTARTLYSLGLRYYDAGADNKALACLRSSQWLGFESIERIATYRGLIAGRCASELAAGPRRILAVGDRHATSARWFPDSDYLLICPEVNGLTPSLFEEKRLGEKLFGERDVEFDVGFGSNEAKCLATAAGIRYAHWHTTDFEA